MKPSFTENRSGIRGKVLSCLLAATIMLPFSGGADAATRELAYIAKDVKSGATLVGKDADQLRHPASLTKMMTLYLLFDAIKTGKLSLGSQLTVSKFAAAQPASKIYVKPGRPISVDLAIDALIIKSANDVATVVAENLAGSEARFAEQMTRTAKNLGMKDTVFKNASGLHHEEQVTTAQDMYILALGLQDRFPNLYNRFAKQSFKYGSKTYGEYNPMLGAVPGVDGIKTGYTQRSGYNLVTNRKYDRKHVIAVVLGAESSKERTAYMQAVLDRAQARSTNGTRRTAKVGVAGARTDFQLALKDTQARPAPRSQRSSEPQPVVMAAARGADIVPPTKPAGLSALPENFFARDEKILKIMMNDLAELTEAKNPVRESDRSFSLFSEIYSSGQINQGKPQPAKPTPLVQVHNRSYTGGCMDDSNCHLAGAERTEGGHIIVHDPSIYAQIVKPN